MIPNVVKGSDMHGLLRYLAGPGRANEHTNPQVSSGDAHLQAWHGAEELDGRSAAAIATYLDQPRNVYGTEIRSKCWQQNPATGAREPVLDVDGQQVWKDVHVWHCSLSLPPGEVLSAERWDTVATEFADGMGFTAASGKAPARWVAVHHGPSKGGNDHVHLVASMVREDGTRWEGRLRDYSKSQTVCRELERRHGLVGVDGAQYGTAAKGTKPVELAAAAKAGAADTVRVELAHRIRAAAVASTSEAEWIRRVRAAGVVLKPRFAAGTTDVVAGYRAALRTSTSSGGVDRLNFYGGGQLGHDLSLPRVRENWPAPTVEAADAASAEWQAAFRGERTGTEGREAKTMRPDVAADSLAAFSQRLANTPMSDRVAWSDAARDLSGALSAWARFDPANAAELRAAATALARSAQDRRPGGQLGRRVKESPMGTAMLFLSAKADDRPKIAAGVLLAQILNTAAALRDYHRATSNLRQAHAVDHDVIRRLATMRLPGYQPDLTKLSDAERAAWRVRQAFPSASPKRPTTQDDPSPLPNPLLPRPHIGARTDPRGDRDGRER